MTTAQLQGMARDPARHYRYIGKDKESLDADRLGSHIDIGYRKEAESGKMVLVSCDKKEHEARVAAAEAKSERSKKAAAKMEADDGFKPERDDLGSERMSR